MLFRPCRLYLEVVDCSPSASARNTSEPTKEKCFQSQKMARVRSSTTLFHVHLLSYASFRDKRERKELKSRGTVALDGFKYVQEAE